MTMTGIRITFIERRIGVCRMNLAPNARLRTTSPTVVSSSMVIFGMRTSAIRAPANRNVAASMKNTSSTENCANSPASAKPMAVDPNWAIAISELAAASSSSLATSGRTASLAGSKNCLTDDESRTITYNQNTESPSVIRNGIAATSAAWTTTVTIMIVLRSYRSTNTPAMRPKIRVGAAETISMMPTFSTESVSRKTMMPAASEVSASPMVETSWADQR